MLLNPDCVFRVGFNFIYYCVSHDRADLFEDFSACFGISARVVLWLVGLAPLPPASCCVATAAVQHTAEAPLCPAAPASLLRGPRSMQNSVTRVRVALRVRQQETLTVVASGSFLWIGGGLLCKEQKQVWGSAQSTPLRCFSSVYLPFSIRWWFTSLPARNSGLEKQNRWLRRTNRSSPN